MPSTEHFRKLERMYLGAPTNRYFNLSVNIREGEAEIHIPVKTDFFHAGGAVHGHVYFKALDDASFFAVNSLVEDVFVLTALYEIKLLKPIRAGAMHAKGRVVSGSRKLFLSEAELRDADGELIATGTGKFLKSNMPLGPEIGYQ